ncbi:MAG TPA: hypothetical protein VE591_14525, partial [Candidatus Acidoferrum sp.]|nr:hypothetical protein [Candidatus Acidoferrum sp.]
FALAALVATTAVAAAQTAPPSPLPEIGRTRSKGFCSTVRDNVAPTLLGLMKTDEIIGAGHQAFAKMAHDQVARSGSALEMDRLYLSKVAISIAHNLTVVEKLLGDPARFPAKPTTDDEQFALEVKARLKDVANAQRTALNIIQGTIETDKLGQMQNDMGTLPALTGKTSNSDYGAATSFLDVAGLPSYAPVSALDRRSLIASNTTAGKSAYGRLLTALEQQQGQIQRVEAPAGITVTAAAVACRDESR